MSRITRPMIAAAMALMLLLTTGCTGADRIDRPAATHTVDASPSASCQRQPTSDSPGLSADGLATVPLFAPTDDKALLARQAVIRGLIEGGNETANKPYRYGGGHLPFDRGLDTTFDASGMVSWALHRAGLLDAPRNSGSFLDWGIAGKGEWITLYTHSSNVFLKVGRTNPLWLVSGAGRWNRCARSGSGPRWITEVKSLDGFIPRHPRGF